MNIYDLKTKTNKYILSRENLNEDEKIQLIEFVEEASEHQVMTLLITGRMRKESNVSESIKEQYNKYDVEKKLNEIDLATATVLVTWVALVGAMAIIAGASELVIYTISKSYRICNKYKILTPEFYLCGEKVKLDGYTKKLKFLKDKIGLCKKAKDPKKCDLKVKREISKTEDKIKATQKEITKYEKKVKSSKHGKY